MTRDTNIPETEWELIVEHYTDVYYMFADDEGMIDKHGAYDSYKYVAE